MSQNFLKELSDICAISFLTTGRLDNVNREELFSRTQVPNGTAYSHELTCLIHQSFEIICHLACWVFLEPFRRFWLLVCIQIHFTDKLLPFIIYMWTVTVKIFQKLKLLWQWPTKTGFPFQVWWSLIFYTNQVVHLLFQFLSPCKEDDNASTTGFWYSLTSPACYIQASKISLLCHS